MNVQLLLDFIGSVETGRKGKPAYESIFGHRQNRLAKPITSMTVDEVISTGPIWARWTPRPSSSAAGKYQILTATLRDLKTQLQLTGSERFDEVMQDRLALQLLKRRGFDDFMAGRITRTEFGRRLAMEWASLPVLAPTKGASRDLTRGQSYYAGDGVNKALVAPEQMEAILNQVKNANGAPVPPDYVTPKPPEKSDGKTVIAVAIVLIIIAFIVFIVT